MVNLYCLRLSYLVGRYLATAGLFIALWLLTGSAQAQTPPWTLAVFNTNVNMNTDSQANAIATDANGNIYVVGTFGTFGANVFFGSTQLTTAGGPDIFLAKYVPATNTWAWAIRAGGAGVDRGYGVAVSGNTVYLTGSIETSSNGTLSVGLQTTSTSNGVTTQNGVASTGIVGSNELLLAAYTDNGASASLKWTQVGGANGDDAGYAVAASGNNVYVTGSITAGRTNATTALFGGGSFVLSGVFQQGATFFASADLVVAAYTDNGANATIKWVHVAGGSGPDYGRGIAVSGNSVYVTGSINNDLSNRSTVWFGGSGPAMGTTPLFGASTVNSADLVVAKYLDNGTSATVAWTQVGGGYDYDEGRGIAVSGTSVYVTGYLSNSPTNSKNVLFGGTGTLTGNLAVNGVSTYNSSDLLLAKYTDSGSNATPAWVQVGGGNYTDIGNSVVVNGNQVYVAGQIYNNTGNSGQVLFGGQNTTPGTTVVPGSNSSLSGTWLVAGYTDLGTTSTLNWTQVGGASGGTGEKAAGLVLVGKRLYAAGGLSTPSQFGSISLTAPSAYGSYAIAALDGTGILANTPSVVSTAPRLYPNPATGPATLSGAPVRAAVQVVDALGRHVVTATTDANGTAQLPAGLTPGLYLVRAGAATVRWLVE